MSNTRFSGEFTTACGVRKYSNLLGPEDSVNIRFLYETSSLPKISTSVRDFVSTENLETTPRTRDNEGFTESSGRSKSAIFGRDKVLYENVNSFFHDIFFHDTRFEISEESLTKLHVFAEYQGLNSVAQTVEIFGRDEVSYGNRIFTESVGPSNLLRPIDSVKSDELRSLEFPRTPTASPPEYFPKISKLSQIRLQYPTLFWCVFVAQYGYSEYLRIGNRYQNRELEEKQRMMETLSKNPKQMKEGTMKLTNDAIQEILSGLMVSSGDSFSAVVAYSTYYNKTIYVVFECSYLVFSMTKEPGIEEHIVLYQTRKHPKFGGSYRLESDLTPEKLEHIHSTKIRMEHYAKPFRGISSYKVAELEKMAAKIGVLDAVGKADLYAKIVEKCCLGIQTR